MGRLFCQLKRQQHTHTVIVCNKLQHNLVDPISMLSVSRLVVDVPKVIQLNYIYRPLAAILLS